MEPLQQHVNQDDLSVEAAVKEILKNQRHMNMNKKLEERVASLENGLGSSASSSDVTGKEKQRLPSQHSVSIFLLSI